MVHVRVFVALIIVTFQSASSVAQRPAAPSIRDSAGVRIVENRTIRNLPPIAAIAATPIVDLGGLRNDPNAEISARAPFLIVRSLSDGRLVTTDMANLKLFDAKGAFIRNVGREGNGPGEFRQLRDVCVLRGDTLVALGYGDRRASVFDSAGRHVRSFVAPGDFVAEPCFADGTLLAAVFPASSQNAPKLVTGARAYEGTRIRTTGVVVNSVGTFPMGMFGGISTHENAVVHGDLVYVGDGLTPDIRVYSSAGKLVRVIRWTDALTPVSDALLDKMNGDIIPAGVPPEQRAQQLARLRALPHPSVIPAYAHVLVDNRGRIWMSDHPNATVTGGWTVFDASGGVLGHVTLPKLARVTLNSFIGDQAVLEWSDDDGARHLTLHRLAIQTP